MLKLASVLLLVVGSGWAIPQYSGSTGGEVGSGAHTADQVDDSGSFWWLQGSGGNTGVDNVNSGVKDTTGGHGSSSPLCEVGYGCVDQKLCINGEIDTTGSAFLNKRTKLTSCVPPNTCCREPKDDYDYYGGTSGTVTGGGTHGTGGTGTVTGGDYTGTGGTGTVTGGDYTGTGGTGTVTGGDYTGVGGSTIGGDYTDTGDYSTLPYTCIDPNEDCVPFQQCVNGEIDTTGAASGALNPRVRPTANCQAADYPGKLSICCRKPGLCPEYQNCVPNNQCGADGYFRETGLTEYLKNGIECDTPSGDYGVCCTPDSLSTILGAAQKCGVRNYAETGSLDKRIQSGYVKNDAYFGEFPWQTIIFLSNFTFQCGGVLISDRHVLTAAHCVYYLKPYELKIRLGEWQVNSFKEFLPYVDRDVSSIEIHPDYLDDNTLRNNIAIMELKAPVDFDYHINTVCLPPTGYQFTGNCVATGWGKDSFYGDYQHILKKVDLPMVDRRTCRDLLRKTELGRYFRLHPSFVCAGGEDGIDTCTGDGGGPLVCQDSVTKQYNLVGLVNGGVECGKIGVPGLYTNVAYMNDWINSAVNKHYSTDTLAGYGK